MIDENIEAKYNKHLDMIWEFTSILSIYEKVNNPTIRKVMDKVVDAIMQITLLSMDILVALKHIELYKDKDNQFETYAFARILSLHCYMLLKDEKKVIGECLKDYRQYQTKSFSETDKCLIAIHNFWLKHGEKGPIMYIRHNLIGHRQGGGIKQAKDMKNINVKEVFEIGHDTYELHSKLLTCLRFVIQDLLIISLSKPTI